MTKPIKFRGCHVAKGGKMVYGDLIQSNDDVSIFDGNRRYYIYPDSVAQLVGYDKDGREVYEGDELVCGENKSVWVAVLSSTATLPQYLQLENETRKFDFTLREAQP